MHANITVTNISLKKVELNANDNLKHILKQVNAHE